MSLVYVVDDDTVLRTAYAAAIHKQGFDIETASDGLEAQKLVAKQKPDAILLDMLMPNMDGITFLQGLRKDPTNSSVKVVISSNLESLPETSSLEVSKYLSKLTHDPDAIAAAVAEVINGPTE